MAMTEETLVQEVTADYLLNQLQWDEFVFAFFLDAVRRRCSV